MVGLRRLTHPVTKLEFQRCIWGPIKGGGTQHILNLSGLHVCLSSEGVVLANLWDHLEHLHLSFPLWKAAIYEKCSIWTTEVYDQVLAGMSGEIQREVCEIWCGNDQMEWKESLPCQRWLGGKDKKKTKTNRQRQRQRQKNSSRYNLAQAIVPGKEISKKYCKLPYYLPTPHPSLTQLTSPLVLCSVSTGTRSSLPLAWPLNLLHFTKAKILGAKDSKSQSSWKRSWTFHSSPSLR